MLAARSRCCRRRCRPGLDHTCRGRRRHVWRRRRGPVPGHRRRLSRRRRAGRWPQRRHRTGLDHRRLRRLRPRQRWWSSAVLTSRPPRRITTTSASRRVVESRSGWRPGPRRGRLGPAARSPGRTAGVGHHPCARLPIFDSTRTSSTSPIVRCWVMASRSGR